MVEETYRKGRKVGYFYNTEIGQYYYGKDHPMKPKRVAMTHSLINNYGMYRELDIYRCRHATDQEMMKFHDSEYIKYLKNYVTSNVKKLIAEVDVTDQSQHPENNYNIHNTNQKHIYNVGLSQDCPGFDGLYNFCTLSSGSSIDCASLIINQQADICINWAGGLHHAKKKEASGFCFVNDIVLCILELLRFYPRVIYIDIDVHHGDGVEEAFFLTNRVLAVSFHQYGEDFFPGSGNIDSIGDGPGKYHSINVPLQPGITDDQYVPLFCDIMKKIMEVYQPQVIILQCGADSLAYDKLGQFNLTTKGHGKCVEHMKTYGIPLIMLGGGGYTVPNVARCWAYETSIAMDKKLDNIIPTSEIFYDSYSPDHKLHVNQKTNMENKNTKEDLEKLKVNIYKYLKEIEVAPSLQFNYTPNSTYEKQTEYNHEDDDYQYVGTKHADQLNKAKNY